MLEIYVNTDSQLLLWLLNHKLKYVFHQEHIYKVSAQLSQHEAMIYLNNQITFLT